MNASTLRANWQTTLSGIGTAFFTLLTVMAAAPYQLGDLATIIPAEWKAKVTMAAAGAAFVLKVWNSIAAKDANVSGNGTLADPARVPDAKNPGDSKILGWVLIGCGVWLFAGAGCAAPKVADCGVAPISAAPPVKWERQLLDGYSLSYGTREEWKKHLTAENSMWVPVVMPAPVPSWTHYRENTGYTRRPGLETLDHYLLGK